MIEDIEKRFKEVSGIDKNLSVFPLEKSGDLQTQVDKEKSWDYGEVFTPLYKVDVMISKYNPEDIIEDYESNARTIDPCSGWGQFTIRWMRFLANNIKGFDSKQFLKNHAFVECQLESVYKLFHIFGQDINIYIGDVCNLPKLSKKDINKGAYIYINGGWLDISAEIKDLLAEISAKEGCFQNTKVLPQDLFTKGVNRIKNRLEKDTGQNVMFG